LNKINSSNIKIVRLKFDECTLEFFSNFNRYQEINRCWRKIDGNWILIDNKHIAQWDDNQKLNVINNLRHCIEQNGAVSGAFIDDKLIGFSSIPGDLFGTVYNYVQLKMLHVTFEYRGRGIGKLLFKKACGEAKEFGEEKLYISANAAEESIGFYKSVGCIETAELNHELYGQEPFDCHLEYCL